MPTEKLVNLLIKQHPMEVIRQFPFELVFINICEDSDEMLEICLN